MVSNRVHLNMEWQGQLPLGFYRQLAAVENLNLEPDLLLDFPHKGIIRGFILFDVPPWGEPHPELLVENQEEPALMDNEPAHDKVGLHNACQGKWF